MGKSILFIDDSAPILELLVALFEDEYSVDIAHNGAEGLEKIKNSFYNLIISDIDMPVMNGIELFEEAYKTDTDIKNRFLIFSSHIDEKTRKKFKKKGLNHIIKPLNLDELKMNIKSKI